MSSSLKLLSIEVGGGHMSNCSESHLELDAGEEDADEEEDVDFNPFLKESPSLEASSSLSSDVEVLDANLSGQVQDDTHRNAELVKEIVTVKKRKAELISRPEVETLYMRKNCTSNGMEVTNSYVAQDTTQSGNCFINLDEEDAICKRTRARYSLAGFTLDELETFLQETDDDDEPYNVDDEEEYKKFLAAVLQDGRDDCQIRQDNENVEDEDEENDADFELELEEALESDLEENFRGDTEGLCGTSRRPETRLNGCQKASTKDKSRLLGQSTKPLRPLLPNTSIASFPSLIPETMSRLSIHGHSFVNGFNPHQRCQLHCLIYEHVQLLIQVFSLCVLDPSRQHIASQVNDLILELLKAREWLMSCRQAPYPFFGFYPPYSHPSGSYVDEQKESSGNNSRPFPQVASPSTEQCGCAFNRQDSCLQTNGPIVFVLDVAPLSLVQKYMEEVSMAVQEYQQRQIQSGSPTWLKSEPLFPFHNSLCLADAEVVRGSAEGEPIKKTLAGVLVERTKKQSVAFVPKEIACLAQRFLPHFNPALFPHKPPPATVANRVLFTDAEDELLALGLMEYNTDWKAIQQHFLPCKSKHQIFVRQKNRSSAKAPENPIKVVRKMKSSPLTKEEIARIKEGLKVFKLDWMSVWRYVVPYRDPSLLPRQWRIANGTQKSYKSSAEKNEKRRLRDKNRKRCKPATLASGQTSSGKEECQTDNAGGENNSGDDHTGNEGGAYVHEAFLADWRPENSSPVLPSLPFPSLTERSKPPCGFLLASGSHVIEQTKNSGLTDQNPSTSGSTLGHGNPQLVPRTYRSRRKKNERLVKLAPDLPPINLPASVRVMSQSVFASLNQGKEIPFKSSFIRNGSQHHSESRAFKDEHVFRGINKPDLQMHPLLFQSSGDQHLPYYQQSCGNSTSISFNFLPPFQPQLNLSFLPNPHVVNQADNRFDKSSKEPTTAGGIDFHPLLQKANDVTTNYVVGHQLTQLPTNSESLRSGSAQRHTEPWVENSFSGNLTESSNFNGNANELELDIHLSLSRQKFSTGIRDVDQPCEHHSPASLGQSRSFDNLDSDAQVMGIWSESTSMHGTNVGDQSLPGIVMEQEELSDSEEEIGEHVDFECEEMDDSEGDEGSGSERIIDLQNKELPDTKVEVVAAKGMEKTDNSLSLNLNSFSKFSESSSDMTGAKHSLGNEETQTKSDVFALKSSKGPTKGASINKTSGSDAVSSGKGDFTLNAERINSTAPNTGRLGKVDSNLNVDVNVENS